MTVKKIQMVNLSDQYKKIKTEIDDAIQQVIDSTAFIKGPAVKQFQTALESYLQVDEVIPCANGTDALQIAMMGLDLQAGDEIITTPFTFISTIEVIQLLGLKPVLADIDPDTFTIDPEQIKKVIGPKTRAIAPVHLFGQCANMDEICSLAKANGLKIIEDTAQAIGANYTFKNGTKSKAGIMGTIGTTSFFPSKNLGAFGDGGALFTNDPNLGEKLKAIVNHGMKRRYYYDYIGVNSRLDSIQAAILSVKLKYLDSYNHARQKAAEYYNQAFKNIDEIQTPVCLSQSEHIYHQYTLKISQDKRDKLKSWLNDKGIPAMIYYPVGLHLQEAYKDLGYSFGDFPVCEQVSKEVLSLPMHTELTEEELDFICHSVKQFFQ